MTETPTLSTTRVPLDSLERWPGNARRGIVSSIKESMRINGVFQPLIVQKSTNRIIAGNHRFDALNELHEEQPEKWGAHVDVIFLDVNDRRALKMNLADNKTSDDATWDDQALVEQLQAIIEDGDDLLGTGFAPDEVDDLTEKLREVEDELLAAEEREESEERRGLELATADVTFGDPTAVVSHGDVWTLGDHILVCAKLSQEWKLWKDYLTDGFRFCPYPEPYITSSLAAREGRLLLVQPDPWLAGHLVDKFAASNPDTPPVKMKTIGDQQ